MGTSQSPPSDVAPRVLVPEPRLQVSVHELLLTTSGSGAGRVTVSPGEGDDEADGELAWEFDAGGASARVAWRWCEVAAGVLAVADPMGIAASFDLVDDAGAVLAPESAIRLLNQVVRAVPWQAEVHAQRSRSRAARPSGQGAGR